MNIGNYYVNNNSLISDKDAYITGNKYRITVLSPRLVRIEYNKNGVFEDRATSLVCNRNFPKTNYSVTEGNTMIEINTGIFTLTYVKDSDLKSSAVSSNIKAVINGTNIEWQANSSEAKNLRGINYSIDSAKDKIVLDKGLYSLDGYVVIDDSSSQVLNEDGTFSDREKGIKDLYLFMYGNDFEGCLTDYYTLTGYPNMIPRYALGAWWYKNEKYSENDICELVNNFNREQIPISVFMLGDYGYNPNISLANIGDFLNKNNINFGYTINPSDYLEENSSKMNFIPFTNDKINAYFNIVNKLRNSGVNIFSIDYNNPNDRINLWRLNHYHYGVNVVIGSRGLILSRNAGIAPHRYPIMWSGKTEVNWKTLNLLPRYNARGYNIGTSFIAHPIGGYKGGIEEEELYFRYMQFSCFSPIFLMASDGGKYYKREPWKWSIKLKNNIINYINLRYRLIPYLYSESYKYHEDGLGIIKPFYIDYPKIIDEPNFNNQYFFGSSFFIAPITVKKNMVTNRVFKKIFVPNGIWFDYFNGKKYLGGKVYNNFYQDEEYPVFVKAGSIIPTSKKYKEVIPSSIELEIFPLDNGKYTLYEDDGTTLNFNNNMFMKTIFEYYYNNDNYTFIIKKGEGRNLINNRNYILKFKNIKNIQNVNINDKSITYKGYYDKDDFIIELYNVMVGSEININITGTDTIVSATSLINEEIKNILFDLEIETSLKELLDKVLFSNLEVRKKRIELRKLKRKGLDNKYIKVFINLLEYIQKT